MSLYNIMSCGCKVLYIYVGNINSFSNYIFDMCGYIFNLFINLLFYGQNVWM